MMRVLVDVRAVVDVPYGTKLTPYAMTLQDSSVVLFETLKQAGYEVIVHSAPLDPESAVSLNARTEGVPYKGPYMTR